MSMPAPDRGMAAVADSADLDTGISRGKDSHQIQTHYSMTVTQADWS